MGALSVRGSTKPGRGPEPVWDAGRGSVHGELTGHALEAQTCAARAASDSGVTLRGTAVMPGDPRNLRPGARTGRAGGSVPPDMVAGARPWMKHLPANAVDMVGGHSHHSQAIELAAAGGAACLSPPLRALADSPSLGHPQGRGQPPGEAARVRVSGPGWGTGKRGCGERPRVNGIPPQAGGIRGRSYPPVGRGNGGQGWKGDSGYSNDDITGQQRSGAPGLGPQQGAGGGGGGGGAISSTDVSTYGGGGDPRVGPGRGGRGRRGLYALPPDVVGASGPQRW